MTLGTGGASTASKIVINDGAGSNAVTLQAPATVTTGYTLILPTTLTKDKYLKTDASTGELIWADGASVDLTGYMTLSTIQSVSGKKTFKSFDVGSKGNR